MTTATETDLATARGSMAYRFSDMVRDTINEHGEAWAFAYYVTSGRLSRWEYRLFAGLGIDDGMR